MQQEAASAVAVGERLVRTSLVVEGDPLGDTVRGVPAVGVALERSR